MALYDCPREKSLYMAIILITNGEDQWAKSDQKSAQ